MRNRPITRTGHPRLDVILVALEQGWKSYRDLEELTGKPERTIRRDLIRLRNHGFRIESSWHGRKKRYRLEAGSLPRPIEPGILEVIAANLGRGMLGFLEGTELRDQMEGLFVDLRSHSRAPTRQLQDLDRKFWFMPDAPRNYRNCDDQLNELVTCIISQRRARITYCNRDRQVQETLIEPYTLVVRRECLYVLAQVCTPHGDPEGPPRPFDVTRVMSVRRTRIPFELPPDWDPASMFKESFGMFVPRPGEPPASQVRIWFTPGVGKIIQQRAWHASQRWSVAPGGGWFLDMTIRICPELIRWVVGFGPDARAVRPEALVEAVARTLRQAARQYERFPES